MDLNISATSASLEKSIDSLPATQPLLEQMDLNALDSHIEALQDLDTVFNWEGDGEADGSKEDSDGETILADFDFVLKKGWVMLMQ